MLEQLEELADGLRSKQQVAPAVREEQTVRLLGGVVMLLRQHQLNKRGQCRFCASAHCWRFWQRRPQCTVYRSLDFVMRQSLDAVWWQLSEHPQSRPKLVDMQE
jgi:hypothetical protein